MIASFVWIPFDGRGTSAWNDPITYMHFWHVEPCRQNGIYEITLVYVIITMVVTMMLVMMTVLMMVTSKQR